MKLAVSNFAWDYQESEKTFNFFKKLGINNLELVLTKYKNWEELTNSSILNYKNELRSMGMTPYSLQSLFYNVNCTISDTEIMINHFKKLIDFSEILGVEIMVFGSPSVRKKLKNYLTNLSIIFKEVDHYLNNKNVKLVIEPNMLSYGGEYFITIPEIIEFIDSNKLTNIKTMVDTHNLILENQNPIDNLEKYFQYIYHIHISEPKLSCIKDEFFHKQFSNKIKELGYNKIITYEVNKCEDLENSIELFSKIYN